MFSVQYLYDTTSIKEKEKVKETKENIKLVFIRIACYKKHFYHQKVLKIIHHIMYGNIWKARLVRLLLISGFL